ncbi:MAG: DUF4255 domain-containing protein [Ardenticatenaceae bacterium]|nr:DUF4255 domain-containing protein [Ardenticatenaceae bacterium]
MIADLDRTIEELLTRELPIKNGEIDIKFEQPKREWSARLARPTVNLFLYDVRENNVLRQHQWQKVAMQNGRLPHTEVQQKRTPFRIDCHYMLTAWATEPQDEHRLMSRCLMALFRHPILPQEVLVGDLKDQPFKLQAWLASHDRLTNPAEVWGSLDNEIRPSVSYIVTLAIDPWQTLTTPLVSTLTMDMGQVEKPEEQKVLVDGTKETAVTIRGTVTQNSQPQPDIQVAIKGTGLFTTTNEEGQFALSPLEAGDHTLVIWPASGQPQEKTISVPAPEYNIDL